MAANAKPMQPTPPMLRLLICVGYMVIFWRGLVYTTHVCWPLSFMTQSASPLLVAEEFASYLSSVDDTACSNHMALWNHTTATMMADAASLMRAAEDMAVYSGVYMIDAAFALGFGWMSMYKHNMKQIFEHHIPGCVCTFVSVFIFRKMAGEIVLGVTYPRSYVLAVHAMISAGLLSQACEFFWVVRSFLKDPDAWYLQVGQRLLGLILVPLLSLTTNLGLLTFVVHKWRSREAWVVAEFIALLGFSYLGMYVQPKYSLCHWKHLRRLFSRAANAQTPSRDQKQQIITQDTITSCTLKSRTNILFFV